MRLTATAWRITQDEYDKKARELKERQTEIALRIEQHQKGEEHFRMTLESLIYLASRAAELFERSKTEQKQQQIEKIGAGRHSTLLRNEARGLTINVFARSRGAPPARIGQPGRRAECG